MPRSDLTADDHAMHEIRNRVSQRVLTSLVLTTRARIEAAHTRGLTARWRCQQLRASRGGDERPVQPRVRRRTKRADLRLVFVRT